MKSDSPARRPLRRSVEEAVRLVVSNGARLPVRCPATGSSQSQPSRGGRLATACAGSLEDVRNAVPGSSRSDIPVGSCRVIFVLVLSALAGVAGLWAKPSPRASSPRSRPSSSTATPSRPATKHDSPSSAGSRASTTAAAGTQHWDSEAHKGTKR